MVDLPPPAPDRPGAPPPRASGDVRPEGDAPTTVSARLAAFARTYPHLPLYRRIAEAASSDDEVAGLLAAAAPGQARPVLLLAALHDLVLRRPEVAAAPWFARAVAGRLGPDDDPWPDVRATLVAHADDLRAVIATRSTQTNEVNRAVYVAALLARAAADVPDAPVALVELGCSAGLLLAVDRYRVELVPADPADAVDPTDGVDPASPPVAPPGRVVLGDPASPVHLRGELRGDGSGLVLPTVVERVGLDRSPVGLDDVDEVRWLEACLWPDQPERLARFRAAVDLVRADPPVVAAGDMVDDLAGTAHAARAVATALVGPDALPVHLVVLTSWALTYVRRDRRDAVVATLDDLASDGRPVTWVTAEPAAAVPDLVVAPEVAAAGETVLGARRWRAGVGAPPTVVGAAHPHATHVTLL